MPEMIDLDDRWDRMQWTCPIGHRSWEPTNGHFWCSSCASASWDVDPSFSELRNARTGETVHRENLILVDEAGTYTNATTP